MSPTVVAELNPTFTAIYVGAAVTLGVAETFALRRKRRGDTISEHVWALLALHPVVRFAAGGVWLWATVHFFFGWL